jgi:nucleoside-diphosphate-sugar epimerase
VRIKAGVNAMDGKNVLITGGAGYIGSVLVDSAPKHWRITVLDNCLMGNSNINFSRKVNIIKKDIRNDSIIEDLVKKSDVVIHLAGIVGVLSFNRNPKAAITINQDATEKIVSAVKKYNKKLVFMSTCSVYGFNTKICTEETIPNEVDDYSVTKSNSEQYIQQNLENYIIFRLGTVYGWSPRMRFDLVINIIIEKMLWNETVEIYGGTQWRPFVHVKDATNALVLGAETTIKGEIFNLVAENHQILEIVKQITDNFEIVTDAKDSRSYHVDNEKIKNQLKWVPEMTIDKTIQEFKKVNYKENIYYNHEWDYS